MENKMKFYLFLALTVFLFGLLIGNAGREAFLSLRAFFPKIKKRAFSYSYAGAVGFLILIFFLSRSVLPQAAILVTWYLWGFFAYFLMIFNLLSLITLAAKVFSKADAFRIVGGVAAFVLLITVFLYGIIHARNLKIKEYSVSLGENTPCVKAALISDLHLGTQVGEKRLTQVRDAIISQKPDVLLIAGDVFDGNFYDVQSPERLKALFLEMRPPMGTFACLGNHDAGKTTPEMLRFLEEAGITLLADEAVTLPNGIVIAGRRDSSPIGGNTEKRIPLSLPESDAPVIVLDHQPSNLSEYGSEADLVLCGHTHKGQIFPIGLITDALFEVDYGYYRRSPDSPQVIVTSGVGFWGPPMRVGSDCEAVFIDIKP